MKLLERRRIQQEIARRFGFFWLPCPVCGEEFGGHEWVTDGDMPGDVPVYGKPGMGEGICPACTRDGYGYPIGWNS